MTAFDSKLTPVSVSEHTVLQCYSINTRWRTKVRKNTGLIKKRINWKVPYLMTLLMSFIDLNQWHNNRPRRPCNAGGPVRVGGPHYFLFSWPNATPMPIQCERIFDLTGQESLSLSSGLPLTAPPSPTT